MNTRSASSSDSGVGRRAGARCGSQPEIARDDGGGRRVSHQDGALDAVRELADVAGPRGAPQRRTRRVVESRQRLAISAA